jgi:PTS system nitrogen regulatory IIA component
MMPSALRTPAFAAILPADMRLFAMDSPLRGLLSVERVALDVAATSRDQVIAACAALLGGKDEAAERQVRIRLTNREALGSTAMGHGCALPHARLDTLERPIAGFIRAASPVPFGAPDGVGTSHFFVLLVPRNADERHLAMLAAVAERFADPKLRHALATCATAADVVALFEA